jgi:hypothetical protein
VPGGGIGRAGADFARPPDRQILGRGEDVVMPYLVTFIAGWLAEKRVNAAAVLEYGHRDSDGEMVRRYAVGAVCWLTALIDSPAASSRLACVCRRSWKRIVGNAACLSIGLHAWRIMFDFRR